MCWNWSVRSFEWNMEGQCWTWMDGHGAGPEWDGAGPGWNGAGPVEDGTGLGGDGRDQEGDRGMLQRRRSWASTDGSEEVEARGSDGFL